MPPARAFPPILQTCFSRSWGGLEIQALEITAHLLHRGHKVWLACCGGSRLSDEAVRRGVPLYTAAVSGYLHPAIAWRLSRFIRTHGIGIVHCQISKDLATVVPAADLAGTSPKILLSKRVGSYLSKRDLLHRYTFSRVSRVLAVSDVIRRNVVETTPASADTVLTFHDAIDTGLFSPANADRSKVRAEFGFSDDTVVVGFAGRFSPGKGHEDFLGAAAAILRNRPGVRFLVVGEASAGEDAYASSVRNLCTQLGLDRAVTFAGFRRDMPDVLAAIDIFAFPSHAESFGVTLIEAMAMERPAVATNTDGVLDIVLDGETGIFVPPKNPQALAAALLRLIDSADLRQRLGSAARDHVVALFDRNAQMDRLEGIYRELAGGKE